MTTPNLELPEWIQNQSQPHVPVNTALRILDIFAQLRVVNRTSTSPPLGSPSVADGECYIVASPASGDWAGYDGYLALNIEDSWYMRPPRPGFRAYVEAEDIYVRYTLVGSPSGWVPA